MNSSTLAFAAWSSIPSSTSSLSLLSQSITEQSPPPTTLLTQAKRDEPWCRMAVKTWPGIAGTSSTTITVELPCASTPWNTVGTPITEGSPQDPITQTVAGQMATATTQQPGITAQQGASAASTSSASVLHMDEGAVAAVISVLSLAVLGAAVGFYFWGRKMGIIRGRKGVQNGAQAVPPLGHG